MPLVYRKHPRKTRGLAIGALGMGGGGAGRIPASRTRSRPGTQLGMTTCSPRARGRPGFERRRLRQGRTVTADGGGRGGLRLRRGGAMPSNRWRHKLLGNLGSSLGLSENTGESWRASSPAVGNGGHGGAGGVAAAWLTREGSGRP
jgi:hypothetical protein